MFKYLFYKIFRFQNRIIGEEKSTAAFSSFLSVSMFWGLNFFTIFIIIDKDFNLVLIFDKVVYKSHLIVPGIMLAIIGFISYFCFYYKSRYNLIISEIENNDLIVNRKYNFWSIVYQIVSLILIIGAIIFRFI